jgi:hypothetical protein
MTRTVTRTVHFKRGNTKKRPRPTTVPRVAQLLALAHLANVTPARITQILRLLDLPRGIQEEILAGGWSAILSERQALLVTSRTDWMSQGHRWQKLLVTD